MTLDVFNQRDAVTVLIPRHGKIGDEHVRIKFRKVINQCCGVFKFANYIHPLDLLK